MEKLEEEALKLAKNPLPPWYSSMGDTFTILHEPTKVKKYVTYGFTTSYVRELIAKMTFH